jgi:hypothetical protein
MAASLLAPAAWISRKTARYVGRFDDDIAQNPRLSHLEIAQFLFLTP